MKHVFFLLTLISLAASAAMAQWNPYGDYTQASSYVTTVQPPINADGSSVWQARKAGAVVPVKFKLAVGKGPLTIASTSTGVNQYGGVWKSFDALYLDDITDLHFQGTMTGTCGGGSPRWQLMVAEGTDGCTGNACQVDVYLTAPDTDLTPPNTDYTDQLCNNYVSGLNPMTETDGRFEMMWHPAGQPALYNTLSQLKSYLSNLPIQEIVFVVDAYYVTNQSITLDSITVNNDTYTFAGDPTPTCTLPTAAITVQATPGSGLLPLDEAVYNLPADTGYFRVADCMYLYNLSTKNLAAGNYNVWVNINGLDVKTTPGQFTLK